MNTTEFYIKKFPDIRNSSDLPLRNAQLVMLRMLKIVDFICRKHHIEYWLDAGTLLGGVRHKGFIPWDDDIDIAMTRDDYNKFVQVAPSELPNDLFLQTNITDSGYFNMATPLKIRDKKSIFLDPNEDGTETYMIGIFLDIFPYDYLPNNTIKRKLVKYIGKKIIKFQRFKMIENSELHNIIIYRILNNFISLKQLNNWLKKLIISQNKTNNDLIGIGLDSTFKELYKKNEIFPLKYIEFEDSKFLAPKNTNYYLQKTFGDYMKLPPLEEQVSSHYSKLIVDIGEAH